MVIERRQPKECELVEAALLRRAGVKTLSEACRRLGIGQAGWSAAVSRAAHELWLEINTVEAADEAARVTAAVALGHHLALVRVERLNGPSFAGSELAAVRAYVSGTPIRLLRG